MQVGNDAKVKTSFALVAVSLLLVGCTKTIDSGSYGPFKIGDSKTECLTKLDAAGIRYVEPLPFQDLYFNHPTAEDLAKLNSSDGIMIWIDQHPWPLRIEFVNNVVSNTWPDFKPNPNAPAYMKNAEEQLTVLKSLIKIGDSRAKSFSVLISFGRYHSIAVANYLAGAEQFRLSPGSYDIDKNDYRSFLLLQDKWKFEGLNDMGWYNAFYSRFTFYFVDGKLVKIEHWRFPFELP